jgi:hypothetical protein
VDIFGVFFGDILVRKLVVVVGVLISIKVWGREGSEGSRKGKVVEYLVN